MDGGECRRDDWFRRSQEFNDYIARIKVAHTGGLNDAAQDLLRFGTAWRAIATGYFSIHDRRPKRLLGAPVRGIERGVKQKAEDRRQFDRQMRREPLAVGQPTRCVQEVEQLRDQMTAGDRGAMRRDLTAGESISDVEGPLEHGLHIPRPGGAWMGFGDLAAATDQMRKTGLMAGLRKLLIRRPPIADQHA